ncbi:MAG: hypothetical protein ACI4U2_05845, partial [Christensenellaceae bacterium]
QAQVTQMNTVAATEKILTPYAYAGSAINALYDNGWSKEKLATYSSGYHYAYSMKDYRWFLLDESGTVVYPETSVNKAELWGLYSNQSADVVDGVTKYIALENVTADSHYAAAFSDAETPFVIDLNGGYLRVETERTNVTAVNGIVVKGAVAGEGAVGAESGSIVSGTWTATQEQQAETALTFENMIFDGVTVPGALLGKSLTFRNCVFYGTNLGSSVSDGDRTFLDCKFYDYDADSGKFAIQAAKNLVVSGCEFTNCGRGINIISSSCSDDSEIVRSVLIENSVFNGIMEEKAIIQFGFGGCSIDHSHKTYGASVQVNTQITIQNNTFRALGKAVGIVRVHDNIGTNANLTQEQAETLVGNVTFLNNTVDASIPGAKYVIDDDGTFTEVGKALVASLLEKFA